MGDEAEDDPLLEPRRNDTAEEEDDEEEDFPVSDDVHRGRALAALHEKSYDYKAGNICVVVSVPHDGEEGPPSPTGRPDRHKLRGWGLRDKGNRGNDGARRMAMKVLKALSTGNKKPFYLSNKVHR